MNRTVPVMSAQAMILNNIREMLEKCKEEMDVELSISTIINDIVALKGKIS